MFFQYPLKFRVIQYLFRKISVVVNMSQEGWGMVAPLKSVRPSWKVPIYYINCALFRFQWPALYVKGSYFYTDTELRIYWEISIIYHLSGNFVITKIIPKTFPLIGTQQIAIIWLIMGLVFKVWNKTYPPMLHQKYLKSLSSNCIIRH